MMSTSQPLPFARMAFRISYAFAMVGGLVALGGTWLLAQPTEGANIGAGLLIIGATGLMALAVLLFVIAVVAGPATRVKRPPKA